MVPIDPRRARLVERITAGLEGQTVTPHWFAERVADHLIATGPPDPPTGWYTFGTHADWDTVPPLVFSEETDEAGMPLFERPASSGATLTEAERVLYERIEDSGETQGLAHRVQETVRSHVETASTEVHRLNAEVSELREVLRIGTELDNHHNAATCPYCRPQMRSRITIDRPVIHTGPKHMSVDEATVHYLREAASRVREHRYWGSGVTTLVADLLDSAATAVEGS